MIRRKEILDLNRGHDERKMLSTDLLVYSLKNPQRPIVHLSSKNHYFKRLKIGFFIKDPLNPNKVTLSLLGDEFSYKIECDINKTVTDNDYNDRVMIVPTQQWPDRRETHMIKLRHHTIDLKSEGFLQKVEQIYYLQHDSSIILVHPLQSCTNNDNLQQKEINYKKAAIK